MEVPSGPEHARDVTPITLTEKLDALAGIESFDEAFLGQIVLPNGETFGPHALDAINIAYSGKPLTPLLAGR
jgi:hypothetical protein